MYNKNQERYIGSYMIDNHKTGDGSMKCLVLDYGGSSVKYALVNENAEMEAAGINEYVAEVNRQLQEFMAKNQ